MTDTLRDRLIKDLCGIGEYCKFPACECSDDPNDMVVVHANRAIASITAWALEPAQVERVAASAYRFEHDWSEVIPQDEALRVMQHPDCLGEHAGDCGKAARVYAGTCMRCLREQMEARGRAAIAALFERKTT